MKYSAFILIAILLSGCGNSKTFTEQDHQKFQRLQDMVMAKNFEIESTTASPMGTNALMQLANTNLLGPGNTANNIDITTNSNILTVKGDTISGYFPYFGEVRFGGGYSVTNHHGIEFKDVPKDYKMTVNDKKHSVNINFRVGDAYRNNEQYNVFILLFPNKRSTIQINSTNRTSIEFTGFVKESISKEEIQ